MNRRDLFKAALGLIVVRALPLPPASKPLFYGIDDPEKAAYYAQMLKAIWSKKHIEAMVYSDNPLLSMR